ncbi:MAG: response regulator transcription factor [Pyramidobacter sp.]|nr:response regulator transcription factor [Pyramidobacter sp.]
MVSLVLADDHPLTRAGLAACIKEKEGLSLLGETSDGQEAWEMIQKLKPDVALLDIRMPKLDGISVARNVKDAKLPTKVIMLTAYNAQQYIVAALSAGAKGFIVKTSAVMELNQALQSVISGGIYLDSCIANSVDSKTQALEPISPREREVLLLSSKGFPVKEVAARLFITERTVQAHMSSVYAKFGAKNKTEALILALKHGVILVDELLEGDLPS